MENYCFSHTRRIKKPKEFGTVYKQNQTRVKGQYFTVLAFYRSLETNNKDNHTDTAEKSAEARLGAVVSKKVSKHAVERNRLKRLMRESFRVESHPADFDFVAIALPGAAHAKNNMLAREINKLWKRVHNRCKELSLH